LTGITYAGKAIKELGLEKDFTLWVSGSVSEEDVEGACVQAMMEENKDIKPDYDEETQYLVNDGYEILEDKVIKKYRIEEIPEREEPRDLEQEIEELRRIIDILIGGEDNE